MAVARRISSVVRERRLHGSSGAIRFSILPVNAVLRYNSAFPYGSNDGAVWAGRGLTSALDLGFAFRVGPLSGTFNPIAFSAQNRAFPLQANGSTNPFADPLFPGNVDRPQRFGARAYSRVDPGESTVRLDAVRTHSRHLHRQYGLGTDGELSVHTGRKRSRIPPRLRRHQCSPSNMDRKNSR